MKEKHKSQKVGETQKEVNKGSWFKITIRENNKQLDIQQRNAGLGKRTTMIMGQVMIMKRV